MVQLKHSSNNLELIFRADNLVCIVSIVGDQNRLHMNNAIAICISVNGVILRLLFSIAFYISLTIIDKDANLSNRESLTLLYPDNLPIVDKPVPCCLQKLSPQNLRPEGAAFSGKADHLIVSFIQKGSCAGGYAQVADCLTNVSNLIVIF